MAGLEDSTRPTATAVKCCGRAPGHLEWLPALGRGSDQGCEGKSRVEW
jgi:hypothetical protein